MADGLDAAALNAGANLLSTGATIAAQANINKKTRQWNEKMYNQQKQDAYEQWVMQNEYNSPQSQMRRLQEAGLNKNLVYGHGAISNTGDSMKMPSPESWNPEAPNYKGVGDSIISYIDMQSRKQTLDNLKTQNTVMMQEAAFKAAQTANVETDTAVKSFALNLDSELRPYSAEYRRQLVDKLTADIALTKSKDIESQTNQVGTAIDNAYRRESNELKIKGLNLDVLSKEQNIRLKSFDESLQQSGMTKNDPMYLRMIKMFYDKLIKR